jgi:two-component system, chemotaxis family, sensor kinase CheA
MDMDMSQYKDLFVSEVKEHLAGLNDLIVALEETPADRHAIDALFRSAHSIKGMAAAMAYAEISALAHTMEDFMDHFRKGTYSFDGGAAELLLEAADLLIAMVHDVERGGTGSSDTKTICKRLAGFSPGQSSPAPATKLAVPDKQPLIPHAEEERELPLREAADSLQTVRVKTELLDTLINITGELTTSKNRLASISRALDVPALSSALNDLSRYLRELHTEVLKVRMTPFAAIADRFPRAVRDVAKKSGKEVSLKINGKEIELDRGILQELPDPLLHILRNAVDHGIESPAERCAAGKPALGAITIAVSREKDRVLVSVEDDGRGMDPQRIIAAAVAKGLLREEDGAHLAPEQAFLLTCLPGFSTASTVSDISGRGVGMDAVRATLRSLGGSLTIDSQLGQGSRVLLSLPTTISIIQALLVTCATLTVAIPVSKVLRTLDIRRDAIVSRGKRKLCRIGHNEIPLVALHRLLGIPFSPMKEPSIPAVVVEVRGRMVALVVDRFAGQQDVFVKPLGRPLNRIKGLFGSAIVGDGSVIFILDPATLF